MLNKQFEEQLEAAMLCIAQEQIHDTPHRFPPDFEMRLMQRCGESEKAWIHTKAIQSVPSRRHKAAERMPRLLTWGSLAAGVTVMLSIGAFMLHEQKNEMQLSSAQIEEVEIITMHSEAATASTDAPATKTEQTETVCTVGQEMLMNSANETTSFPVQSSVTVNETQRLSDTEAASLQKQDTTDTVTTIVSEKAIEAKAVGDFDLDGVFSPADCAWASLIRSASVNAPSVIDMLPLTNEQLQQCALISFEDLSRIDPTGDAQQRIEFDTEYYSDADAFDLDFPLSSIEFNSIMETGRLVYTYSLFPDLDVRSYLTNQSYYNDYLIEQLPTLNQNPPANNMQEQDKWMNLKTMICHYIVDLAIEKNNETHEVTFRPGDDQPFGDVTWEQLLAELEDAKTWKGPIQFRISRTQDHDMHEST